MCVAHKTTTSTLIPIHIKFHKVGSGTVSTFLRQKEEFYNTSTKLWKKSSTACGRDPFGHSTLTLYRTCGKQCFASCVPQDGTYLLLSVFRPPVERVISQLYFWNEHLLDLLENRNATNVAPRSVLQRLASNPRGIAAADMRHLIQCLHQLRHGDDKVVVHEYSYVLCDRDVDDKVKCLKKATKKLKDDFDIIGTMDSIPSLFVLLGEELRVSFRSACDLHIRHAAPDRNMAFFGNSTRPPPELLFNGDVLKYLEEEFAVDNAIYKYAKQLHLKMLRSRGLTFASAMAKWTAICG